MHAMEFRVRRRGPSKWVVTLENHSIAGIRFYGAYLDKEQAVLDAVDAGRDALQAGCEARVWVMDRSTVLRVF
jgi:hypothetical protein